jgi:hypothetical protein
MALDFDSPPPGRRIPYKKHNSDPNVMAVDGQIPSGAAILELPRTAEWVDYSNEEAGLRSSDGNDETKTDPAWCEYHPEFSDCHLT